MKFLLEAGGEWGYSGGMEGASNQQVSVQAQAAVVTCPVCHVGVKPTDYFCANCGRELHAKPKSVSLANQLAVYVGSLLLPPLGFVWGWRYLKQEGSESKRVGWVAIVLTVVSLVAATAWTIATINTVNEQVARQMENLQGW